MKTDPPAAPRGHILYAWTLVEADGDYELPRVVFPTAEGARAAAVSFLADRLVGDDEADTMLDWSEDLERVDGKYPAFTAQTKHGRSVRVYPIEVIGERS